MKYMRALYILVITVLSIPFSNSIADDAKTAQHPCLTDSNECRDIATQIVNRQLLRTVSFRRGKVPEMTDAATCELVNHHAWYGCSPVFGEIEPLPRPPIRVPDCRCGTYPNFPIDGTCSPKACTSTLPGFACMNVVPAECLVVKQVDSSRESGINKLNSYMIDESVIHDAREMAINDLKNAIKQLDSQ